MIIANSLLMFLLSLFLSSLSDSPLCGVCARLTCWLLLCVCVCLCVNMKGPNRKILLDLLCSVGVQRCLPPSPGSPPPPPISKKVKPQGIGNTTTPSPLLLPHASPFPFFCHFKYSSLCCQSIFLPLLFLAIDLSFCIIYLMIKFNIILNRCKRNVRAGFKCSFVFKLK